MQARPHSILFVCMGNICRSPAAENIFRQLVTEAKLDQHFHIDSAGTLGYHEGNRPDSRMRDTLEARGIPTTGRARQVKADDFDKFDLILAADASNIRDLHSMLGARGRLDKIRLITNYCRNHDVSEVPDPYYGGQDGFEKVVDLLQDACQGLLDELVSEI